METLKDKYKNYGVSRLLNNFKIGVKLKLEEVCLLTKMRFFFLLRFLFPFVLTNPFLPLVLALRLLSQSLLLKLKKNIIILYSLLLTVNIRYR